ncbi:hypothetical protein DY245_18865 [Streptomyces inhibens]|uniref:Uncharacterized protein n=1 Tax=Streptomyces inhibens TaxID=2293571 RepID=A0A371Q2E2_STRIH|nr:hypothetical protein DY245_18865 [Streptomyces inhibens]
MGWLTTSVRPKGSLVIRDRDELGRLLTDEEFADLFPPRGGPHRAHISHFGLLRPAEQHSSGSYTRRSNATFPTSPWAQGRAQRGSVTSPIS